MLRFVLCLGAFTLANCLLVTNPVCTIWPKSFLKDGQTMVYTAIPGCMQGTIDWNYPKSFVTVHFHGDPLHPFEVCFTDNVGGDIWKLFDATLGVPRPMTPLVKGTKVPSCITGVAGIAILQINAPTYQTYAGAIDYKIIGGA